jgi:hypothetical protein
MDQVQSTKLIRTLFVKDGLHLFGEKTPTLTIRLGAEKQSLHDLVENIEENIGIKSIWFRLIHHGKQLDIEYDDLKKNLIDLDISNEDTLHLWRRIGEKYQAEYERVKAEFKEENLCCICLENEIGIQFLCSHAVCKKCSESLTTCPLCRAEITIKINTIY